MMMLAWGQQVGKSALNNCTCKANGRILKDTINSVLCTEILGNLQITSYYCNDWSKKSNF